MLNCLYTATSFKYFGSLFTSEGGSQVDVNNRIRIGWMKWKEVSGVMCYWKMPMELKDKVFKTNLRPAIIYIRFWMLGRKEEIWEQTQLSWNEDVEMGKREDQVGPHQKRRHQEGGARKTLWKFPRNHIRAKSLRLEFSGRRSRGRPKKRWRDNIKGDMKKYQLTEDMAQDRK